MPRSNRTQVSKSRWEQAEEGWRRRKVVVLEECAGDEFRRDADAEAVPGGEPSVSPARAACHERGTYYSMLRCPKSKTSAVSRDSHSMWAIFRPECSKVSNKQSLQISKALTVKILQSRHHIETLCFHSGHYALHRLANFT